MIKLMKYTYLLENNKIKEELKVLYDRYSSFLVKAEDIWQQLNEARAILYLTGQIYCEQIAPEAIQRRLPLLKTPIPFVEFLQLVDSKSEKLEKLREDELFAKLEEFYEIIKAYKNKCSGGKFYLNEEKFIQLYGAFSSSKDMDFGYKGKFDEQGSNFMK